MTSHLTHAQTILAAVPDLRAAAPQIQIALAQAHATIAVAEALQAKSAPEPRRCPTCQTPIWNSPRRYCSQRCRDRAKYERRLASGYEQARNATRTARFKTDPDYRTQIETQLAAARVGPRGGAAR